MKPEHTRHDIDLHDAASVNLAYTTGIALNLLFVIAEAVAGFWVNSLSLLSDAGHNLADVVSLALSLLAFRLMSVRPNEQYTYGYRKTSVLVSLLNTMFLLVSVGAIVFEAMHRLLVPENTSGSTIAVVAAFGILINGTTAYLFMKNSGHDINIRSAYLHLLADALISAGVVAGGVIIYYTGWYWIDPLFSIVVAVAIVIGTWSLLRSSIRLSLDGVPRKLSIGAIREEALSVKGISGIHHIHVWAISTTETALTAHVLLAPDTGMADEALIKDELRRRLGRMNISHVTLETERGEEDCPTRTC